jgi:hypothetical protein
MFPVRQLLTASFRLSNVHSVPGFSTVVDIMFVVFPAVLNILAVVDISAVAGYPCC